MYQSQDRKDQKANLGNQYGHLTQIKGTFGHHVFNARH